MNCDGGILRHVSLTDKIQSSDIREDIVDEVIELDISLLEPFFHKKHGY